MKLTNFYPNLLINQNKTQNYQSTPKIGLQKDTISFTARVERLIERYKTMEPNSNHNINMDELLTVLRYFGYTEGNGTNHRYVEDGHGHKFTYTSTSISNPNCAASVIRGVQYADELDGALIMFEKKPSEAEIEKYKKHFENFPPYTNPDNKYAQKLHQERLRQAAQTESVAPKKEEGSISEEAIKKINELGDLFHWKWAPINFNDSWARYWKY